jgi:tyrosyl-tRNA synthetase
MSFDQQLQTLVAGTHQVTTEPELRAKLESAAAAGRPLRIKLGLDPTAPDLHLGHSVVLKKVRQFQDLGHRAVVIVGDYTARVGDPTGQNATRPILSDEQIEANARTYFEQAGLIVDTSEAKLEIRPNSEWLGKLSFADVIRLCSKMTVARMLERDTFERRHVAGVPIGIHEMLYPLMQGYDSIVVEADVELGGTDQTFNNLVGRTLQRDAGQEPQVVMILPILVGTDGVEKMSKSKGNHVGLLDPPEEKFAKTMSIPDEAMANWYELLTDVPAADAAAAIRAEPMEAKKRLAMHVVAEYHTPDAAAAARTEWEKVHSQRELPEDIPEFAVPADLLEADGRVFLPNLMKAARLAASTSAARRLIDGGGVRVNEQVVTMDAARIAPVPGTVIQVGRRKFVRLK